MGKADGLSGLKVEEAGTVALVQSQFHDALAAGQKADASGGEIRVCRGFRDRPAVAQGPASAQAGKIFGAQVQKTVAETIHMQDRAVEYSACVFGPGHVAANDRACRHA